MVLHFFFFALSLLVTSSARAIEPAHLWTPAGAPVTEAVGEQRLYARVPDGSGGILVAGYSELGDIDPGSGRRSRHAIFVQRLTRTGAAAWGPEGRILTGTTEDSPLPLTAAAWAAPDGHGGMIVVWIDDAGFRAQRVARDGSEQWQAGGLRILGHDVAIGCAGAFTYDPIAADGAGGLLFAAPVKAAAAVADGCAGLRILAQRLDGAGARLWGESGVPVGAPAEGIPTVVTVVGDGAGGGIVVSFEDVGADSVDAPTALVGRRLDASGSSRWPDAGVVVGGQISTVQSSTVDFASDGEGWLLSAWEGSLGTSTDPQETLGPRIWAQRTSVAGHALWGSAPESAGIRVSDGLDVQRWVSLASDGAGGAFVAFVEREGDVFGDSRPRAQHLSAAGERLWSAEGAIVRDFREGETAITPAVVAAGEDRAIVLWDSLPSVDPTFTTLAQKIDGTGEPLWDPEGFVARPASPRGGAARTGWVVGTVSDGAGGLVLAYETEGRSPGTGLDVAAVRVSDLVAPPGGAPEEGAGSGGTTRRAPSRATVATAKASCRTRPAARRRAGAAGTAAVARWPMAAAAETSARWRSSSRRTCSPAARAADLAGQTPVHSEQGSDPPPYGPTTAVGFTKSFSSR